MTVYRVTTEKYLAAVGEYWTNVYHVNADTLADAETEAVAIVDAEKPIHATSVLFTKVHVDDGLPHTDVYWTGVINEYGTHEMSGADLFPLFVVARVDFTVAGGGRPSRKYLRGCVSEGEATITAIHPTILANFESYGAAIAATAACDPQGQDIVGHAAWPFPAMRQLRRGSKKRSTP